MAKTLEERGYPIIDVHGHQGNLRQLVDGSPGMLPPITKQQIALEKYFRHHELTTDELLATLPSEEEMLETFRTYGVHFCACAWTAPTGQGELGQTNDYIYELWQRNRDICLGYWACVDPWMGEEALKEAERVLRDHKALGIKFQQPSQKFHLSNPRFYPLWDLIASYDGFIQWHGGYTGVGTGMPGGGGIKVLEYTNPVDVDNVAADFPKLRIILMHISDPFTEAAELVCMHKGNVFRETSGALPKYLPERIAHDINTRLKNKFMFGSEYPYFRLVDNILDGWEKDFEFREGIAEKLFYQNALNILGDRFENAGADLSPWKGLV
ncbi:MAG: amidohydrolase family protein [Deltaproteobacteria bacterium]|nr:amidohydrolase family protein [Deltaproteobacteria bacterium]